MILKRVLNEKSVGVSNGLDRQKEGN